MVRAMSVTGARARFGAPKAGMSNISVQGSRAPRGDGPRFRAGKKLGLFFAQEGRKGRKDLISKISDLPMTPRNGRRTIFRGRRGMVGGPSSCDAEEWLEDHAIVRK